MSRRDNPFVDALCATDEHDQWMRAHHGSKWDYHVADETIAEKKKRHRDAKELCAKCPEKAREACRDLHEELTAKYAMRVPGIWDGVVYADRNPYGEPATNPPPLFTREELAA